MLEYKMTNKLRLATFLIIGTGMFLGLSVQKNSYAACDITTQCCVGVRNVLPGECWTESCDKIGPWYVSRSNGDPTTTCQPYFGRDDCCVYQDFSLPCGGCLGGGSGPSFISQCLDINIIVDGVPKRAGDSFSLIQGQTYTSQVTMRNNSDRQKDSWPLFNHPWDWPRGCDGHLGNGENDPDACSKILYPVNSAGDLLTPPIYDKHGNITNPTDDFWKINSDGAWRAWEFGIRNANPPYTGTTLGPNSNITYTFNFVAPAVGTHNFSFRMMARAHPDDGHVWRGGPFGQACTLPNVVVVPPFHSITGKLWLMNNNCNEDHSPNNVNVTASSLDKVRVNNLATYQSDLGNAQGPLNYKIDNVPHNLSINSLYVTNATFNPPVDYNYIPACFRTATAVNSGNGVTFAPILLTADQTGWDIGYRRVSTLNGWFVSIDGDIYTRSPLTKTLPTNPPASNLFNGYLIERNTSAGFIFSDTDINVATSANQSRIVQTGKGGFIEQMQANHSFWPAEYAKFKTPTGTGTFSANLFNGSNTIPENSIYLVDTAAKLTALNNVLNTNADYNITNDGAAMILITQQGTVRFNSNLLARTATSGRLLFALGNNVNVEFGRTVGYVTDVVTPSLTTRANIEASIVAITKTSSISAPGSTVESDPDRALIIEGQIIAAKTALARNKFAFNDTPAEILRYNNQMLYKLTKWERSASAATKTGLFITDTVYQVSD